MFGKFSNYHKIDKKFKKSIKPSEKINKARTSTQKWCFKYMAGQLSNMIIEKQIDLNDKNTRFQTPFTTDTGVRIRFGNGNIIDTSNSDDFPELLAICKEAYVCGGCLSSYDVIAKAMSGQYTKKHLEIIYDYLTLPSDADIKDLDDFNKLVKKQWPNIPSDLNDKGKERARKALNYLSAILMIAEPHRFQDQGRPSRALIRRMWTEYPDSDTLDGKKQSTPSKDIKKGSKTASLFTQPKAKQDIKIKLEEDLPNELLDNDNEYMSEDEYTPGAMSESEDDD